MAGLWLHVVKSSIHCEDVKNDRWKIVLTLKLKDDIAPDKITKK